MNDHDMRSSALLFIIYVFNKWCVNIYNMIMLLDSCCCVVLYFNGTNLAVPVDPIPGLPCLTGLYVMENSPK